MKNILNILFILIPLTLFVSADTSRSAEITPGMLIVHEQSASLPPDNQTQSVYIHDGWNMVSWHIEPLSPPFLMQDILPEDGNDWFFDNAGKVCKYDLYGDGYPSYPNSEQWEWNLEQGYYFDFTEGSLGSYLWEFENRPTIQIAAYPIEPNPAWDRQEDPFPDPDYTMGWYFISYPCAGYSKVGTTYDNPHNPVGDEYSYKRPFHDLIWDGPDHIGETEQYMTIVKSDDGKYYIPNDPYGCVHGREIDNLVFLEPGKGYFLGFRQENTSITFPGWDDFQTGDNIIPDNPDVKNSGSKIASVGHFQYNKYTHWSYPVVIDTVDLEETPMTAGYEIGVFDGDMCVGSAEYAGEFPMIIACWEDDIATSNIVDGYIDNNPMIFVWYDASENQEITFVVSPTISAVLDNPIAPSNAGFGAGVYAVRSFMNGAASAVQLPTKFKLGQNYPNPFNAVTLIPLELPQRSKVKLEIFNIRGQLLGMPYETIYDAGWHKIKWDASKLPSGVYFCRITAEGLEKGGNFTDVNKMLLVK